MTNLNPAGADVTLLGMRGYPAGQCLRQSAIALGAIPSLMGHATANAFQAWHEGTHNMPGLPPLLGTPGFWSGAGGKWDVALYHGNGLWVGVDARGAGVSGVQTTAQRGAQVGGAYQGYQLKFLGYDIVGSEFEGGDAIVVPDLGVLDMYTIRNWQTGEVSLWDGETRVALPLTVDINGICAGIQFITGQPADPRATADGGGPWANRSSAEIALLDGALSLFPKQTVTVPPITLPPVTIDPAAIKSGVQAALAGGFLINTDASIGKATLNV